MGPAESERTPRKPTWDLPSPLGTAAIDMGRMGGQNGPRRLPQENGSADNDHPEWRSACAARTEFRAEQEAPAPARARSMKRNTRSAKADPLEREIELALEPGAFISDRACFKFAGELDGSAP